MAIFTMAVGADNTTLTTFKAWAVPISNFFATAGWLQQTNTGQAVWTATVLTCTSVAVSGSNATYAYSSFTGPTPRVGMSFVFSTFSQGGNNVTATVISLVAGVSVTVTTTTQVTDTTGSGTTTAQAAVPGTGAFVYEIWKTGDSVGFDVYVKVEYGTNSGSATAPAMFFTIGTGTNGASTITGASTRIGNGAITANVNPLNCHLSGDTSRMTIFMWHGSSQTASAHVINLERSLDSTGAPVGTYYNIYFWLPSSTHQQVLFPSGTITTDETGGFSVVMPKTATTGNFGATTHVSPVFPLIGGIGYPSTGIMVYRGTDYVDNLPVSVTIYSTLHLYNTLGVNSTAVSNNGASGNGATAACGIMVRYD